MFKNKNPDKSLIIDIYKSGATNEKALFTQTIPATNIGWSAKNVYINPNFRVKKGGQYIIVLRSDAATGCYGVTLTDIAGGGRSSLNAGAGTAFKTDEKQTLKFETFISAIK